MSTLPSLRRILAILVCSGLWSAAVAQDARLVRGAVTAYTRANDTRIMSDLALFLAIPNLASDSVNIRRNARHLVQLLERRGIWAQLLEAPGSPPAVFGELRTPGATRTVVFYAHYDGQPVDTALWANPPWHADAADARPE